MTAVSPVVITGLTNGTVYDVVLRTVTANGPSDGLGCGVGDAAHGSGCPDVGGGYAG